jgi:hypothetical protein
LKAASAGSVTKLALHESVSEVVSELLGSTGALLPVKPPPVLATSVHAVLDAEHGAWTENSTLSDDVEVAVMLRPWICEPFRVTPACGVRWVMLKPAGAVRLNELTCPLVVPRVNVRALVAPEGIDEGEIVPTAVVEAARADGATAIADTTSVRTSGAKSLRERLLRGWLSM